jgi:hypothetical protein
MLPRDPKEAQVGQRNSRYSGVEIAERIAHILCDDATLSERDVLTYEWAEGYERLHLTRFGGGSLEFQGAYHPGDGSCVGTGVCHFCGRTLHDDA